MSKTLKQRQLETGRTLALNGAKWRRLRAQVLTENPLCEHCLRRGYLVAGKEVDHINNDPSDNHRDNLQSLCKPCHSRKTQADMGKRSYEGCDANGLPLDPNHPWNVERSTTERLTRSDPIGWTLAEIKKIAKTI